MHHVHLPTINLDRILLTHVLIVLVCCLADRLGVEGKVSSDVCILGLLARQNRLECCLRATIAKHAPLSRNIEIDAVILRVLPGI